MSVTQLIQGLGFSLAILKWVVFELMAMVWQRCLFLESQAGFCAYWCTFVVWVSCCHGLLKVMDRCVQNSAEGRTTAQLSLGDWWSSGWYLKFNCLPYKLYCQPVLVHIQYAWVTEQFAILFGEATGFSNGKKEEEQCSTLQQSYGSSGFFPGWHKMDIWWACERDTATS